MIKTITKRVISYYHLCLTVILLVILTACRNQSTPPAVVSEVRHFSKTNYTVQGEFLLFFDRYGGKSSLGPPLTDEIMVDGWRVQYFEQARLEYHPENEPDYRITVGWLGDLLQRRQPPIPPTQIPRSDDPYRRYFPETGHTLSGDFLVYFETHGDTVRFGQPISEPFIWQGRLTQDFQSARFFWTPDQAVPITLEAIGQTHLETIKNNLQLE